MAPKRAREDDGGGSARPRFSALDAETLSFFSEIAETLKSIDNDEERALLADNVLEEASGRAAVLATDAACSRVLEALLPLASTERLCVFVAACIEGDNLATVCTSGPFGSHVLEKGLAALAARAAVADAREYEALGAALEGATEAIAGALYDVVTSKYGSFVARRLLCILAGRDVAPPPGKKAAAQAAALAAAAESSDEQAQRGGAKPAPRGGALAAKLGTGSGGATGEEEGGAGSALAGADYPELLQRVAEVVLGDEWSGPEMVALQGDAFASPFLQALLRACQHGVDPGTHQRLVLQVLGVATMDGLTPELLHRLLQDRAASHLMEVVFQTAPDDLFQKLCTQAFKGHLVGLAQHATANFGVQAALSALRKPQQLKRMFEDLRPQFGSLLRARRAGVLAALLAASARLRAQEADVAAALWHAAAAAGGHPLEALLTLDTTTQLGAGGGGGRLSTLGCAMLQTLFRLPGAAVKQWSEALQGLSPGALQQVAKDPGGCRVLESYLEGPGAAPKRRRALLGALAGAWGAIAMGGSGSHFVECCYALGEAGEKEAITAELAAAEAQLAATHRGPALLRRCHVDEYKKGSGDWQKRVAAADAARKEFAALFGEGDDEGADGDREGEEAAEDKAEGAEEAGPSEEEREEEQAAVAVAAKAAGGKHSKHEGGKGKRRGSENGAEEQQQLKKKKRKKQEAEAAEQGAAVGSEQQPKRKNKKWEAVAEEGSGAGGEQRVKKGKKKRKPAAVDA